MNRELKLLLLELLKRENEITDSDFLYDAEYSALIKMLDEILANDFQGCPLIYGQSRHNTFIIGAYGDGTCKIAAKIRKIYPVRQTVIEI